MKVETTFERASRYYKNEVIHWTNPLQTKIINQDEMEELIKQYDPFSVWRLIWSILWDTGIRRTELVQLQVENFNDDCTEFMYKIQKPKKQLINGVIHILHETRIAYLNQSTAEKLKLYIKTSHLPYGYLFGSKDNKRRYMARGSLNKELDRVRKKLAKNNPRWLEKNQYGHYLIAPHSFRRSWITRYAPKSTDPFELASAIGHKDPRVTMQYYQFTKFEKLKKFVQDERVEI